MKNKLSNLLVLTFWSYKDALIQTYTLPYLRLIYESLPAGSTIYLLTLEKASLKMSAEEHREAEKSLADFNIRLLSYPYYPFGLRAAGVWLRIFVRLFVLIWQKNIRYLHPFATPAGLAAYILSLLTGRKIVLDSYEPHAEASVENGDWSADSFKFRFLFGFERLQSARAHRIISATAGMHGYAVQKYGVKFRDDQFFVKPACTDLSLFSQKNRKNPEKLAETGLAGKIVCVYAGKFGGIYLEKEVFDFLKICAERWGNRFAVLLLTSQKREEIEKLCREAGLPPEIVQNRFVFHAEVPDYMGLADFALTPVKPVPSKRFCTPIKNGEYWALGLPVVSTAGISDDAEIIENEKAGALIHRFDAEEYRRAAEVIEGLLAENPDELYSRIRAIAEKYRNFDIARSIYQTIYEKK